MEMYQKAERAAQEAVLRAAQQSASIGLPYTPPPNVNVNLQDIKMVGDLKQRELNVLLYCETEEPDLYP